MVNCDGCLQGLLAVAVFACTERTTVSHIPVCGNGAHSGKGIVHYHEDNLTVLPAKVPCSPWGEEETHCRAELDVVSY